MELTGFFILSFYIDHTYQNQVTQNILNKYFISSVRECMLKESNRLRQTNAPNQMPVCTSCADGFFLNRYSQCQKMDPNCDYYVNSLCKACKTIAVLVSLQSTTTQAWLSKIRTSKTHNWDQMNGRPREAREANGQGSSSTKERIQWLSTLCSWNSSKRAKSSHSTSSTQKTEWNGSGLRTDSSWTNISTVTAPKPSKKTESLPFISLGIHAQAIRMVVDEFVGWPACKMEFFSYDMFRFRKISNYWSLKYLKESIQSNYVDRLDNQVSINQKYFFEPQFECYSGDDLTCLTGLELCDPRKIAFLDLVNEKNIIKVWWVTCKNFT